MKCEVLPAAPNTVAAARSSIERDREMRRLKKNKIKYKIGEREE
jgi:hypothetical protein